ncbi:MAG: PD-(D/E)XK nuclease family protein, partial [Gammaproteobacteria bacterium]
MVQRLRHAEGSPTTAADAPAWQNGYRPELPVSMDISIADQTFTISGRIDGAAVGSEETLIEEYKTTRTPAVEAHARHGIEHQAQLRLYAGLLAASDAPVARYRLRLTYVHPDHPLATGRDPSLDQQADAQPVGTFDVEETLSASEARAFLSDAVARVQAWFELEMAHLQTRDRVSDVLAFPYPAFRPHQRALALRCYRALMAREPLLLEAPTGTGKTAAILFPAARALGRAVDGHVFNRIMFLTSRTTGSRAALDALARINGARPWLRVVQLQARERLSELDGAPCEPRTCPRAVGYFDRVRAAVRETLDRVVVTAAALRDVASAHRVCPHELALDVAVWSDVIIGDYNYVFDPGARLQRAAPDGETIVLIDEAHQLVPRVRDMLAREIDRDRVRAALREAPPEPLRRRIRGVARQLDALAKTTSAGEQRIPPPAALMRALGRLAEEATESGLALEPWPQTRDLVFESLRWSVLEPESDPRQCWRTIRPTIDANALAVRLDWLDPGPEIRAVLEAAGAHVRYSGTVSPLGLYQRLHGFPDGPADRGGSLFHAEQLAVLHVPDVPTYLRAR